MPASSHRAWPSLPITYILSCPLPLPVSLSPEAHVPALHFPLTSSSTSIQFGADFYTTSAQATGLAANAVIDLYKLVSMASGIFFLFVGGVEICLTLLLAGKQCEKAEERKEEDAPAAAAPETT